MSYSTQIAGVAEEIISVAKHLEGLEKSLADWKRPKGITFFVSPSHHYVVREDGTVTPGLEGVQREAIALHESQIFKAKSRLEGLRWKLVQLGKARGEV